MRNHWSVFIIIAIILFSLVVLRFIIRNPGSLQHASSIESNISSLSTLYLLGGGERPENNTLVSTINGIDWRVISSSLPFSPRTNQTFLPWKNGFIVFGGYGYNNGSFNFGDVWYSKDGLNWSQILDRAPWEARSGNAGLLYKDTLYLIGGETYNASGSNFYNDVWKSTDGVHWVREKNAPWLPRSVGKAVVFKNKIWIIGGGSYSLGADGTYTFNTYKDVWSFDGTSWKKELDQAPWDALGPQSALVYGENLYVIADDGLNSNVSVWSTKDGVNWVEASSPPNFPQYNFTSFVWAGKMWLAGGTRDEEEYNGLWGSTNGIDWQDSRIAIPAFAGEGHGAVVR